MLIFNFRFIFHILFYMFFYSKATGKDQRRDFDQYMTGAIGASQEVKKSRHDTF